MAVMLTRPGKSTNGIGGGTPGGNLGGGPEVPPLSPPPTPPPSGAGAVAPPLVIHIALD